MIAVRAIPRMLRDWASGPRSRAPRWSLHQTMFRQSVLLVSVYYIITAAQLYDRARNLSDLTESLDSLDLLWPIWWMRSEGVHQGGQIIAQIGLAAGLLGIVLWRLLAVRILVSIALLFFAAYSDSHGATNSGGLEWFWLSVCFWLLPVGRIDEIGRTRAGRMRFLTGFSMAPLLILLFYTLSGLYKFRSAFEALAAGYTSGFSPDALAITAAGRAIETGSHPLWTNFIIQHPWMGWPLYTGLYFVELFAILIFFRPALHRAWGLILIMFHFGTLLFMDITFDQHVMINGFLFVLSPFAIGKYSLHAQLMALPVVGDLASFFLRRRAAKTKSPAAIAREGSG